MVAVREGGTRCVVFIIAESPHLRFSAVLVSGSPISASYVFFLELVTNLGGKAAGPSSIMEGPQSM